MLKSSISWAIRFVPRPILQRISVPILAIASWSLRGKSKQCPICKTGLKKFLPYGRRPARDQALCPKCLSLERHRLIWLFLERETSFFTSEVKFLHVAPEICFIKPFSQLKKLDYITADLNSPWAKVKMDIHEIPFEDNTFDAIMCNHVLEHVRNDRQAMQELYRVLKPGGWAILQIPFFYPLPDQTIEDDRITSPKEREKVFGQRDHVRLYGKDYRDRLSSAGFQVKSMVYAKSLPDDVVLKYGLPVKEELFYCVK